MSNSKLVSYTKLSKNHSGARKYPITKITIHHAAGNITLQALGNVFSGTRQVSANYGVDSQGKIGLYVDEANRAWTSSNADNDNRAITIEVANDGGAPNWHVSDKALAATIDLCVDICKRNNIKELNYTGDKTGNLTEHNYFAATGCPGPYLKSKLPYIAEQVNKQLAGATNSTATLSKELYRVQIGAFSNKANAEKMLQRAKAAGFTDAYISLK